MSDLNRKKFEAWFIQKANKDTGMCMSMADIAGKRGPKGDYDSYGYLHGCWVGWQASRECLVIELPDTKDIMPLSPGMYVHEMRKIVDENKYTRAIDLARCAIHAAGVKTK